MAPPDQFSSVTQTSRDQTLGSSPRVLITHSGPVMLSTKHQPTCCRSLCCPPTNSAVPSRYVPHPGRSRPVHLLTSPSATHFSPTSQPQPWSSCTLASATLHYRVPRPVMRIALQRDFLKHTSDHVAPQPWWLLLETTEKPKLPTMATRSRGPDSPTHQSWDLPLLPVKPPPLHLRVTPEQARSHLPEALSASRVQPHPSSLPATKPLLSSRSSAFICAKSLSPLRKCTACGRAHRIPRTAASVPPASQAAAGIALSPVTNTYVATTLCRPLPRALGDGRECSRKVPVLRGSV